MSNIDTSPRPRPGSWGLYTYPKNDPAPRAITSETSVAKRAGCAALASSSAIRAAASLGRSPSSATQSASEWRQSGGRRGGAGGGGGGGTSSMRVDRGPLCQPSPSQGFSIAFTSVPAAKSASDPSRLHPRGATQAASSGCDGATLTGAPQQQMLPKSPPFTMKHPIPSAECGWAKYPCATASSRAPPASREALLRARGWLPRDSA